MLTADKHSVLIMVVDKNISSKPGSKREHRRHEVLAGKVNEDEFYLLSATHCKFLCFEPHLDLDQHHFGVNTMNLSKNIHLPQCLYEQ